MPKIQDLLEMLQTMTTLGMSGPEDANCEAVRMIVLPLGSRVLTAVAVSPWIGLSPSGELVAITVDNKLSIYRLPLVCEDQRKCVSSGVSRRKIPIPGDEMAQACENADFAY
jgi:hypothetical protein